MRLDIAAGTAVRFEPGQTRDVQLVALAGKKTIYGFRGDVMGKCEHARAAALVSEAAELAARRHNGMARKGRGSEPYINHLAEVANLLSAATDGADAELVAAGWLHDTIEDTETTREELARDIFRSRRLAGRRVHRRHEAAEGRAPPPAGDRCTPQIARRETDQDRRQDQQYRRARSSRSEPRGA